MKKGLSVLLIAAALFGFYGGAVNLNDVLACKDYWEQEDERTTADLNKLEDGLNQLKENEQAYLDGIDTLAEGEQTLADGEQAYAAGQAELAKGEADYAAAPGKLADARKKLAAGAAALSDGQDSINGLTKLIKGIKDILKGYNGEWRPGYEKLKDGRNQLYKGSKGSKDDLTALAAFLPETSQAGYVAAVKDVAGDDEKQTAKDYKDFIKSTNAMADNIPVIQKSVKEKAQGAKQLLAALNGTPNDLVFAGTVDNQQANLKAFGALITDEQSKAQYEGAIDGVVKAFSGYQAAIKSEVTKEVTDYMTPLMGETPDMTSEAGQAVMKKMAGGMSKDEAVAAVQEEKTAEATQAAQTKYAGIAASQLAAAKAGIIGAMTQIEAKLAEVNEKVNGDESAIKNVLLPGLKQFNSQATSEKIDDLVDGQNTIGNGIRTIASAVLGNSTLRKGVEDNMGSNAIALLKTYKANPNLLNSKMSDFAAFEKQMDTKPGFVSVLTKAQKLLAKTKADGLKTLSAGKKTLANGKKQYAQGLADFKAAPAKLAAGRAKLADAEQQLADGRVQLAEGREKLAEYEDGEQQVRDGLATLMASEANGGLQSILDRRSGDEDFDNGDEHLELDEGLDAVSVGREYKADSGELVTAEIMKRAIGTGLGLAAGALAILAGLLSLLKKNKGAGVCAVLTAIAGGAGIAAGTSAGTEFSSIAGSAVGATPWIAFGILAAVAAVHAIAHFAAKPEA